MREKFFPTKQTTDIREIDDYAVAGLSQIRSGSLRTKKWRLEIGIKRRVPSLLGSFAELGFQKIRGIVDENLQVSEMANNIGNKSLDGGDVREFRGESNGATAELLNFGNYFLSLGSRFSVVDGDIGAFLPQPDRNRASEALGRASDQRHAPA